MKRIIPLLFWVLILWVWIIPLAAPALDAGSPKSSTNIDASTADAELTDEDLSSSQPDAKQKLPDWAPKLTATVKPANAIIGDPILVTLKITHHKGISVNLPIQLSLGKFTELSREESSKEIGAQGQIADTERTFLLKVAAYELGEQILPPIEVTALGPQGELITLTTEAMPIKIQSVLRNEPNPKLKGPEPPITVYQRTYWLLYLLIGLSAAGITIVVTLLINRRLQARRRQLKPPPPPVPPHLIALRRLAEIDMGTYISSQNYKGLYLLLSEILREYLGNRWSFDALEMTTTEINTALEHRSVAIEIRHKLELYFNNCDLVKFAKYLPDEKGAYQAHQEAESLVRMTTVEEIPLNNGQAHAQPEIHGQKTIDQSVRESSDAEQKQ